MPLFRLAYKGMQTLARALGFDLVATKRYAKEGPYERVTPKATYAPWRTDQAFVDTYAVVKGHTLVDVYRCYELWQLVAECARVPGALLEVGVWRGGSGALIAKRARMLGITDTVYLCDTFSGVVKAGPLDTQYRGGEHADASKDVVTNVLDAVKVDGVKILVGTFPEETGGRINDSVFRFCHIDVDVYQSAKDVLEWVWPKLAVGGIVVFDDYGFSTCEGVTRLVNEERNKKDRAVIHNLNGHAVLMKRS